MIKSSEIYFTVNLMCRLSSVSLSVYSWKSRSLSDRDQANQLLFIDIKLAFDEDKGRPGSPRISKRLQDEGKSASQNRVAKLMRDNDWRAKAARKYKAKKVA
jgi:transposase InsO family protein